MISKRRNSRFYLANSGKILPKSKRSQSEIITTVLIILLVLAAIVIVWQVVQGTIGAGTKEINKKKDCLGLDIVVMKAIASKGTCAPGAGMLADCVFNDIAAGTDCPTNSTCTVAGAWTETSGKEGSILIRREGTSTAKGIKTQLLINDKINASHNAASDAALDTAYATDTYLVNNLAADAEVQITPLLTDNTACGLTEKTKVTSV